MPDPSPTRRDFLTGRALRTEIEAAGDKLADRLTATDEEEMPTAGPTVRLGQRAMACEFDVILNPGPAARIDAASAALDLVTQLEDQLSVYRPHTEVSDLNRTAADRPVVVEPRLFELLQQARQISEETGGAFDLTSGPLVALWRRCQAEKRLPTTEEIMAALARVGSSRWTLNVADRTVRFAQPGVEINLGAIGKGYALDRAGELLDQAKIGSWLIHGGKSSLLARGEHEGRPGWPIGLRNPLFPERTLGTVLLCDRGVGTSGSGNQSFRVEGRRYGHLLDPRTGWPVERMLSATVLAPTAALADALSTAFFVLGVEKARDYCHNHQEIHAILVPAPEAGRRVQVLTCNLPEDWIFWNRAEFE